MNKVGVMPFIAVIHSTNKTLKQKLPREIFSVMKAQYGHKIIDNGFPAIRFERKVNHTPEEIWNAITETKQLKKWFPADLQGERRKGATIQIVSFTDRFPPTKGEITAFEPHNLFEYTWGNEILRWKIHQNLTESKLTFTNILDENAENIGIADIATAWHSCLDVLDFILYQKPSPYTTDERFLQIHSDYLKLMEKKDN